MNTRQAISITGTALFLALTTASTGHATTWYMATTGNDSNPGTQGQPFQTMLQAANAAAHGDTILVGNGTYEGPFNTGFLISPAVTIRSLGGPQNCIFDARGFRPIWQFSNTVTVEGFTLKAGHTIFTGGGLWLFGQGNVVRNCRFENCSATGDALFSNGGAITLEGATTIENSTFVGCIAERWGGAIYVKRQPATIRNCTFENNGAVDEGGAIMSFFSPDVTIANCVFRSNQASAGGGVFIYSGTGCGNCGPIGTHRICNSVFVDNRAMVAGEAGGLDGDAHVSAGVITNCILWGNTAAGSPSDLQAFSATYSCIGAGNTAGTGNISSDPVFVSATDFHLQPGSPCRNAGIAGAVGIQPYDPIGAPRVMEGAPDMGSYEFLAPNAIFVDRNYTGPPLGSMSHPFHTIVAALGSYLDTAPRAFYVRASNYPEGTPGQPFNLLKPASFSTWGPGPVHIGLP